MLCRGNLQEIAPLQTQMAGSFAMLSLFGLHSFVLQKHKSHISFQAFSDALCFASISCIRNLSRMEGLILQPMGVFFYFQQTERMMTYSSGTKADLVHCQVLIFYKQDGLCCFPMQVYNTAEFAYRVMTVLTQQTINIPLPEK